MVNKDELVIRWLEEPVEAACGLCESEKSIKFKKGPVVSLISGELICQKCAAKEHLELHGVYMRYNTGFDQRFEEFNQSLNIDNIPALSLKDYPVHQLDDIAEFKFDDIEPLYIETEDLFQYKCAGCIHTFQPKNDPKGIK